MDLGPWSDGAWDQKYKNGTREREDPYISAQSPPPSRLCDDMRAAQYHGAEDAALRILPAVAPMCIDPIGDVRSSALQVCL